MVRCRREEMNSACLFPRTAQNSVTWCSLFLHLCDRSGFSEMALSFRILLTTSSPHPFRLGNSTSYTNQSEPGLVHSSSCKLEEEGEGKPPARSSYLCQLCPPPPSDTSRHSLGFDHAAALHGLQCFQELASTFHL